jgi:cyclase
MRHRQFCLLVTALFLVNPAGLPAQNFDSVQVRTVKVAEGVHMLMGAGGNIGVLSGEDGVIIVDDDYAPLTARVKTALTAISPRPLRFVLNTHWHGDHTGGNENLGNTGVLIVAHDNVRKRMSVDQFNKTFNSTTKASPKAALPVVTFTEEVTFHVNGDDIRAFHVPPAHTDGDAVVYWQKANVFHMGDTFFNGMYPFIDVSSAGSLDGMIGAADIVLRLANASSKIIPGHGELSDRAGLQAYRDMLVAVRDKMKSAMAGGKTKEQVIAAKPTAAYDAKWGNGFLKPEQFAGIVFETMKR